MFRWKTGTAKVQWYYDQQKMEKKRARSGNPKQSSTGLTSQGMSVSRPTGTVMTTPIRSSRKSAGYIRRLDGAEAPEQMRGIVSHFLETGGE